MNHIEANHIAEISTPCDLCGNIFSIKNCDKYAKMKISQKSIMELTEHFIWNTRSCAALRAADLDWIVGPEYSSGGYIFGDFQLLRRRSLWWFKVDWGNSWLLTFLYFSRTFDILLTYFRRTFHLHWGSTALLWFKKRHVTNTGPQPTSFGANEKVLTGWSNWPSWHSLRCRAGINKNVTHAES